MVEDSTHKPPLRKKIFLLYPHYWPSYKAGGPVQSLFNLVGHFNQEADFYLIALDHEIDGTYPQQKVRINEWTRGPQNENIYYVTRIFPWHVSKLIREVAPDLILLNGIFNIETTLPGLIQARLSGIRTVISPRGMLPNWALRKKWAIKRMVLATLRLILRNNEVWHATTTHEMEEIHSIFGRKQRVSVASNIPRRVSDFTEISFPGVGGIKLVFLSLISRNKNLHLIIEWVCKSNNYSLDIYGPVIDKEYWNECQALIAGVDVVTYKGPVPPWEVPAILKRYHFLILPTKGENFGHAIFDALASGIPVIISRFTPWKDLEKAGVGFYIDIEQPESMGQLLAQIASMHPDTYNAYRHGSLAYAKDYWSRKNYRVEYGFLLD